MTGAAISTIPTLIVFLIFQRYIIQGVVMAGLEGMSVLSLGSRCVCIFGKRRSRGRCMTDQSVFPDPTYRDTVLAPLFEGVKAHYAGHMARDQPRASGDAGRRPGSCLRGMLAQLRKRCGRSRPRLDVDALTYTGEFEDYFFLVEAELKRRLGDLGGALHTARSRNDMDHTLFKLALAEAGWLCCLEQALSLTQALIAKAEAEKATLIVAYTHGQPAQPTTWGHYLGAVIEVMLRDIARGSTRRRMGWNIARWGPRRSQPADFRLTGGAWRGFWDSKAPQVNSYGCIASVDYVTGLYSAMKLMFLHLGRVIQDMQFWTAFEVGTALCPQQPCADQFDHAAEAQPGAHRASAPSGKRDSSAMRCHRERDAQHALHRHERQRR